LDFCPNCESHLTVERRSRAVFLSCPNCLYIKECQKPIAIVNLPHKKEGVIVLGRRENNLRTLPTISKECNKCGGKKAEWWIVQTRENERASTTFYRCVACGHTWREEG